MQNKFNMFGDHFWFERSFKTEDGEFLRNNARDGHCRFCNNTDDLNPYSPEYHEMLARCLRVQSLNQLGKPYEELEEDELNLIDRKAVREAWNPIFLNGSGNNRFDFFFCPDCGMFLTEGGESGIDKSWDNLALKHFSILEPSKNLLLTNGKTLKDVSYNYNAEMIAEMFRSTVEFGLEGYTPTVNFANELSYMMDYQIPYVRNEFILFPGIIDDLYPSFDELNAHMKYLGVGIFFFQENDYWVGHIPTKNKETTKKSRKRSR